MIFEKWERNRIMINKKRVLYSVVTLVFSLGMLSACGKTTGENATAGNDSADAAEGPAFGLADYEGFYCRTETEEMEGFEITNTYGYQLNGDGTGVSYGQDVVDFTWNETEIHFADSTMPFTMEPGKLTLDNITYDKIEGNFITPDPCSIDVENIEDGSFNAYIDQGAISEATGKMMLTAEIFTVETYDIVDINSMAEGDVIYINGRLLPVNSIEKNDNGLININGGIEEDGSALRAIDESNCFVYTGMDMEMSYCRQGIAEFTLSDSVKFIDNSDPAEEKVSTGADAVAALQEKLKDYPMTCYECKITVENGEIVEINRMYRP